MCGFAGFLSVTPAEEVNSTQTLQNMADVIAYRGPDDHGLWLDASLQIGLAHRRLAIVDLSSSGHQPMYSASQRYIMVFNGEIYNHQLLRAELSQQGHSGWHGHSDTETILRGFDAWGIEQTIIKLVGMFALAVWDTQQAELVLVRDRAGEKPLYYGWNNGVFLFGSELKSLQAHPAFDHQINRDALALYMQFSYVPTPYSIYQSVQKLPAGAYIRIKMAQPGPVEPQYYWRFEDKLLQAGPIGSVDEVAMLDQLHQLIRQSVQSQMMADVPLGAFLSGGVDSSLVVSVMQSMSKDSVKTFTIGFDDTEFNEAQHAARVAAHLGTDHHELYITAKDMLQVVPNLASIYDEPFADSSQIPTFLVSQLAKTKVTVALSGDAGDELFAGYSRYQQCLNAWQRLQKMPVLLRQLSAFPLKMLSPFQLNNLAGLAGIKVIGGNPGHRLAKLAALGTGHALSGFYRQMLQHVTFADELVLHSKVVPTVFDKCAGSADELSTLMLLDSLSYLPDDILTKVDRASMANSLESRIPLLDHRVIEFALQMPMSLKVKNGQTKWCLRQLLDQYVPRSLIERPKKGFGVPLAQWLRAELKQWAEAMLQPALIKTQGYLDAGLVGKMWHQHQAGVADWHFQLWNVLMFQLWLQQNMARR